MKRHRILECDATMANVAPAADALPYAACGDCHSKLVAAVTGKGVVYHADCVRAVKAEGLPVARVFKHGLAPTALKGDAQMLDFLFEIGVVPTDRDMICVASKGRADLVRLFADKGGLADEYVHKTIQMGASMNGYLDVLKVVCDCSEAIADYTYIAGIAARFGHAHVLQFALDRGGTLEARVRKDVLAGMVGDAAGEEADHDAVRAIVESRAWADPLDDDGSSGDDEGDAGSFMGVGEA